MEMLFGLSWRLLVSASFLFGTSGCVSPNKAEITVKNSSSSEVSRVEISDGKSFKEVTVSINPGNMIKWSRKMISPSALEVRVVLGDGKVLVHDEPYVSNQRTIILIVQDFGISREVVSEGYL